jgi:phage-related holin
MKEVDHIVPALQKLFLDAAALKWPLAGLMMAVEYVLPTSASREAAIGAFALLIADTLTGFVAAWQSGEKISSARFGRVLVKILGYGSVLVVSAVVANNLTGLDSLETMGAMAILTLIITTEAISVLENVHKMGVRLPFGLSEILKARLTPPKGDE